MYRLLATVGSSLCKRLKHAAEVGRKAKDELSRLIQSSNGMTLTSIFSFGDTIHV